VLGKRISHLGIKAEPIKPAQFSRVGEPSENIFVTTPTQSRSPIKRFAGMVVVVVLCVATAGAVLLHHFWPFTESSVRSRLGESAGANVKFGSFHEKYFPPGCIMENVVFQRGNSGPSLIQFAASPSAAILSACSGTTSACCGEKVYT
jgi:hypothetical protein